MPQGDHTVADLLQVFVEVHLACQDLDVYGTGVVRIGVDLARPGAERTVVQRIRPSRWYGRPMFTLKDDDPQITWDHKAMAARPFRARKD